jgi:hypothetical protein
MIYTYAMFMSKITYMHNTLKYSPIKGIIVGHTKTSPWKTKTLFVQGNATQKDIDLITIFQSLQSPEAPIMMVCKGHNDNCFNTYT